METINPTIPAELLETLDPTPEDPEQIRLPRAAWLSLIQTGRAETETHYWIWTSSSVQRISKIWQDIIILEEVTHG